MAVYSDERKNAAVERIHDAIAREVEAMIAESGCEAAWLSHWVLIAQWSMAERTNPFLTRYSPRGTDAVVENGLLFEALHNWDSYEDMA